MAVSFHIVLCPTSSQYSLIRRRKHNHVVEGSPTNIRMEMGTVFKRHRTYDYVQEPLTKNYQYMWKLVCRSCPIDCSMDFCQFFDARYGVKKQCQTWHWVVLAQNKSMPCLASFFDAMSGVKNQSNFVPVINCSTSANKPSDELCWA